MNDSLLTPERDRPFPTDGLHLDRGDEETLVADGRSGLSPSQLVEQRLIGLLKSSPLLVSQLSRRLKPGPR